MHRMWSQPTLGAVGLSYWAGQYCLRSIAEAARQSDMLSAAKGERHMPER